MFWTDPLPNDRSPTTTARSWSWRQAARISEAEAELWLTSTAIGKPV